MLPRRRAREQEVPALPRILGEPYVDADRGNAVKLTIDSTVTGLEVLKTLDFFQPDPERRRRCVRSLIRYTIENRDRLRGQINVTKFDSLSGFEDEGVLIDLGPAPSMAHFDSTLSSAFKTPEEVALAENSILAFIVEQRFLDGASFGLRDSNPITGVDNETFDAAIATLHEEQGRLQ